MKKEVNFDNLPDNCLECPFNQTKYCSLKIFVGEKNTFVQNNRTCIDIDCPLKSAKTGDKDIQVKEET